MRIYTLIPSPADTALSHAEPRASTLLNYKACVSHVQSGRQQFMITAWGGGAYLHVLGIMNEFFLIYACFANASAASRADVSLFFQVSLEGTKTARDSGRNLLLERKCSSKWFRGDTAWTVSERIKGDQRAGDHKTAWRLQVPVQTPPPRVPFSDPAQTMIPPGTPLVLLVQDSGFPSIICVFSVTESPAPLPRSPSRASQWPLVLSVVKMGLNLSN